MHTATHPTTTTLAASPQPAQQVAVFFYGSFMRREVMAKGGFAPETIEVARLGGFDIHIDPHANISRSGQHAVYGVLVLATHADLQRLYSMDGIGVFLPQAVLVETEGGKLQPALCYIPPARGNQPADRGYLAHLVSAARGYGFPGWYVERLESFAH
ncbi:Gamma-glutamyl cyclotransferase, AIG2-like [Rhodoferax sp. OV413]|uniref:gamma-glutamylcyclotransferase family protein n=1 Tax=Rhodoferax sp. OV413 TaxID=1855285 RepID=UPI00087E67ED|nr:gamma-glutamylcyclotransferase family protein [Rhodoferax sp. OV413]SDP41341.1 Gamma-glutamyl cyclotransferase, AIG2-like [Rhodoferax sp. OV413]